MTEPSWYYLHTNGELTHKRFEPDPSDFVRRIWRVDVSDRSTAWVIVLESLAMGACVERVSSLCDRWKCDVKDVVEFMVRHSDETPQQRNGLRIFLDKIVDVEPDEWFDWLEKTPKGGRPNWEDMPTRKLAVADAD